MAASPAACLSDAVTFRCVSVVSVYDGDTVTVTLPNLPPIFGNRIGVRLNGIDTPELHSTDACEKLAALKARDLLTTLVVNAKRVDLAGVKRDKYFRILASVLLDGKDVSPALLSSGLAYPYHGEAKTKRSWCTKK